MGARDMIDAMDALMVRVAAADLALILGRYQEGDTTVYPDCEEAVARLTLALDTAEENHDGAV